MDDYWDRGLLGLISDPNFSTNPYLYVLYAYDALPNAVAPKWSDARPSPPGATTDGLRGARPLRLQASGSIGAEQALLTGRCQQFPSHSVGNLAFGADGALYVSSGDGANFNAVDYGQWAGGRLTHAGELRCGDLPGAVGIALTPPFAEGGALRSQSLKRAAGHPALLNGAVRA